ncbi:MAG: NAD(+)/NADH kinase [Anaerolineaceae bacterium]|nr:NAD(+)/NADH kinase [Anaerolineaceae bacterium]
MPFRRTGILAHPRRPQSAPVAREMAALLRERGLETWVREVWTEEDVRQEVKDSDLVVAIGGDGAMLHAARVCAEPRVPVLGVNMGNLGFLTEIVNPGDWAQYLDRLLGGDFWIEERMMIRAQVLRDDAVLASEDALNDVVVSSNRVTTTARMDMYIDGDWATTYTADALVIATATGATAYALAAGGPILPPELVNILVVPVAPHLSMNRPIVLSQGSVVDVIPAAGDRSPSLLSVDGRILRALEPDEQLRLQASARVSRFVRMRDRNYFYRSLLDRLEPRLDAPPPPALPRRGLAPR